MIPKYSLVKDTLVAKIRLSSKNYMINQMVRKMMDSIKEKISLPNLEIK